MISTGGPRNSTPGTLNQLFFKACERRKPDALQVKRDGRYQPISHDTLKDRVRRASLGLDALGVRPGDRVAILSTNRPDWVIADLACLTMGAADVPIYPNLPPDQTAYIVRDSGAVAIFTSDAEQTSKITSIRGECPALRHVITFDEGVGGDLTLAALEAKGSSVDNDASRMAYRARADAVRPDDLATIIYTSGTTGDPKGVMLTHDNLYSDTIAACAAIPNSGDDTCLSFLPLSHSFERTGGLLRDAQLRREHRVRRIDGHGAEESGRGSTDARPLRAASVREDVRPRARERALGRRAQEADLLLGAERRRAVGRREAGRWNAGRTARTAVRDRASPRVLEAAGAHRRTAQVFRIRRRAARARDQSSSSTPRASSSSRATDSPRRRP